MTGDFETHPTGTVKALKGEIEALKHDVGRALDCANAYMNQNVRLQHALQAIIDRSEDDPLGTSKVVDMRNIAKAALKGEEG